MWEFNGEDDTTRYGRKGPDSAAALEKILSSLYKGEKEEFLRVNPRAEFSMYQGCQNRDFESNRSFDGRIANRRIFTIRIVET